MTSQANTTDPILDALVSQCFRGGEVLLRELRLTPEQARRLAADNPARVEPLGQDWYEISFQEASCFYVN